MRVLQVIAAVAPRYGGPSTAIVEMTRALIAEGVDAAIATTDADGEGRLAVATGRQSEWQGVPSWFFGRQWGEAYKFSLPLSRWLRERVRCYDVVHVHGVFSQSTVAAAAASHRSSVPYVVRALGHLDAWSLGQRATRKKVFLATVGRGILPYASAIHFTTEEERAAAGPLGTDTRGVVIPLGVAEPNGSARRPVKLPPGWGEAGNAFVLFLGRIHEKKGLETLIDGVLGKSRSRLVIAGDGDPRYLHALSSRYGAHESGRVCFVGWLEPEERAWVLARASLFALLSRSENFGLAVAEAMAAGLPPFVSRNVNIARVIEEGGAGWVVDPDDEAWTAVLEAALSDEDERAQKGARAREVALSTWSWSATARQLVALYESLVTPGKGTA